MILHLVRHGQTNWNAEGRLQGQTMDVPLSDDGVREAHDAASRLADIPLTALWTSDQLRATQTAETIAAHHDVAPYPTALLREQSLGVMEGRLTAELTEQQVPDGHDISEIRWGGGESIKDVHHRMTRLVSQLRDEFGDDDEVALVSHGDALRVLLAVLDGRGHRDVIWAPLPTGTVLRRSLDGHPAVAPDSLLERTLAAVQPACVDALAEAERWQGQLTKPPGSLGMLETVGNRLAAIAGQCPPPMPAPAVVGLFAGDHGVCAQGITSWPPEVTAAMLSNIATGGAAINALAEQAGATLLVTDVGVATDYPRHPAIRHQTVARGTRDFTIEPAMTRAQAQQALEVGIEAAEQAIAGGARCLLTGDMGIGNTTPASALIAVFTGTRPALVTGRGAGADDAMVRHKTEVIERALKLHQPQTSDPLGVLAAVGGLEHAALAGFILAGAAHRVPVILDGVIAVSGACAAVAFAPAVRDYLLSGHAGAEPGIRVAVEHLGLQPLVDLGLRLGEGSGAALALPMVQAAAKVMRDMATFADAGITAGDG